MKNIPTWVKIVVPGLIVLLIAGYFMIVLPFWGMPFNGQRHGNPPLTPSWALECWLWEDDVNTAAYVDELLSGYKKHDIPVRTILLDSPWSTRYNDFIIDEERYPQPDTWFRQLETDGYRVVLWMTGMVNSKNKDTAILDADDWFQDAKSKGYLMGDGFQDDWWKGTGGFIDYSNPQAMKWWRGLQQRVFDLGIDGWKLDGAATLCFDMWGPLPLFYKNSYGGLMTTREYIDHYYRDEYQHALTQNPEFATLARSIDRPYIHPEGFAPIDAAPVTWVGDQRHSWKSEVTDNENDDQTGDLVMDGVEGIEMALENIMAAAKLGYNVIGSDVAGFSGRTIPPRLYIRWAQFSTFCGLFLNGGHGDRALWNRTPQELEIIRRFSWLHTELIPYMYHYIVSGHQGGTVLQSPVDGAYQYLFGDNLLIAPIFEDNLSRSVILPEGQWRYLFEDASVLQGDTEMTRDYPLEEFPVYIREGAIIPLNVTRAYTGFGDSTSAGFTTILMYPFAETKFDLYQPKTLALTEIGMKKEGNALDVSLSGHKIPHILRIHSEKIPKSVTLDGRALLAPEEWRYNRTKRKIIIRTADYDTGRYMIVFP